MDAVFDVDRCGEVEGFPTSVGERDLDFCAVLLRRLRKVLTGDKEFASSSEPSKGSDLSGLMPGSLEADLDLDTSCSLDEMVLSPCSLSMLRGRGWASNLSAGLSM